MCAPLPTYPLGRNPPPVKNGGGGQVDAFMVECLPGTHEDPQVYKKKKGRKSDKLFKFHFHTKSPPRLPSVGRD